MTGSSVHDDETQSNRQIVSQAFEAWREGARPITDVFAPQMTWRIEGHSVASKKYTSARHFVDEVLTPFAARFASGERFRPNRIRGTYADGGTVIVLWDGHGVANDGQPYENSYAWFMRMQNGKVVEGIAFYESISFNDLWSRVPG